jgi:hypothetical protein
LPALSAIAAEAVRDYQNNLRNHGSQQKRQEIIKRSKKFFREEMQS